MSGQVVAIVGGVAGTIAGLAVVFVLGMRTKSPLVLRVVIWFAKTVANPRELRTAGMPGASASVVRHRGRKSGRTYATPVGVVPADGVLLIALPYGSRANWLRNVLANGSATIVHEGSAYEVDRPEIVRMSDVADCFSAGDRRSFRLFHVDECLRVRVAAVEPVAAAEAAARA